MLIGKSLGFFGRSPKSLSWSSKYQKIDSLQAVIITRFDHNKLCHLKLMQMSQFPGILPINIATGLKNCIKSEICTSSNKF